MNIVQCSSTSKNDTVETQSEKFDGDIPSQEIHPAVQQLSIETFPKKITADYAVFLNTSDQSLNILFQQACLEIGSITSSAWRDRHIEQIIRTIVS